MYKVEFVKAQFAVIGKTETVDVPTGEKKKFLGIETNVTRKEKRWIETGYSDSVIDGERFAKDVDEAVNKLSAEGFAIVSITPVTSGHWGANHGTKTIDHGVPTDWYAYGFSYTEGVLVVAQK
jgi:hypothetical protein